MRRAQLTKEQTQMIQSQVGVKTTVEKVQKALYLTLGQDHKLAAVPKFSGQNRGRWRTARYAEDEAYWEMDDDDGGEYYEAEDEWNGDEAALWQDEEFDDGATYYGSQQNAATDMPDGESVFDTEEFDRIYAAYTDSKKQLNQMRAARGFYPVVALTSGSYPSNLQLPVAASSGSPSRSPSKGKGKKGKKGSKGLSTPKKGKGVNCYSKSKDGGSPSKKRAAPPNDDTQNFVGMAQHIISDQNQWISKHPDACVQDGGASTFLAGSEYVLRYLKHLELIGTDMSKIAFKRCNKSFKFGGDGESVSNWMVQLPAKLGGKYGFIQRYVMSGATPLLLGRPILEMLDAVVSFGQKKMSIMGGEPQDIKRGKGGAMLLRLAEGVKHGSEFDNIQFDLVSEDNHDEAEPIASFSSDLHADQRFQQLHDVVKSYLDHASTDAEDVCHADDVDDDEGSIVHERTKLLAWFT